MNNKWGRVLRLDLMVPKISSGEIDERRVNIRESVRWWNKRYNNHGGYTKIKMLLNEEYKKGPWFLACPPVVECVLIYKFKPPPRMVDDGDESYIANGFNSLYCYKQRGKNGGIVWDDLDGVRLITTYRDALIFYNCDTCKYYTCDIHGNTGDDITDYIMWYFVPNNRIFK